MSDLIEQLRTEARKQCDRHNNVDQFTPSWQRKPKDFIEWKAADEIERLTADNEMLRDELEQQYARVEVLELLRSAAQVYEDSGEWTDYQSFAAALKAATEKESE
jgi:head-tail adaptor